MQMVIFCGGLATRLRPLTEKIPKSMVRINGKPFLVYQIEILKKNNVKNVVLCTGFLGEQIKEYFGDGKKFGINIKYSEEKDRLLGTGGALINAEHILKEKFFTMYGDSYLLLDFRDIWRYFDNFKKMGMMVVYKNYNRFDRSNVTIRDNYVTNFYKDRNKRGLVYIDSGASVLRKSVLDLIPTDTKFSLNDVFIELIKRKELLAYRTNQRFYEIGSKRGLEEFKKLVSERAFDYFLKSK